MGVGISVLCSVKSSSEGHNPCADMSLSREVLWGKGQSGGSRIISVGFFFPFLHPLCPPFVCAEEDGNDGWVGCAPEGYTHISMLQLGCGAC